jgi:hypothetical protein
MTATRFHARWYSGTNAERLALDTSPLPTPTFFVETDTNDVYQWTGSTWSQVNGGGGSGSGDMEKSVYDADDDGVVDEAEAVAWSGVSGKPSEFTPADHSHVEDDISNLNHTDVDAVHTDEAGEIAALTEKASPAAADLLLIEDSEASNDKKKVQISNLPSGSGGASAFTGLSDTPASYSGQGEKVVAVKADESGLEFAETGSGGAVGRFELWVYG